MFKTRLLSGIVLVIIAAASIAAGGPVLFAVLLAISLIGVNELYRAMDVHQKGFGPLGQWRDMQRDSFILYHPCMCVWSAGLIL